MHWKFLRLDNKGRMYSAMGRQPTWQKGTWHRLKSRPSLCRCGYHCSDNPLSAFTYVAGEVVAQVEVGGESIIGEDKSAHQKMRIVRAWRWTAQDSAALAEHLVQTMKGVAHLASFRDAALHANQARGCADNGDAGGAASHAYTTYRYARSAVGEEAAPGEQWSAQVAFDARRAFDQTIGDWLEQYIHEHCEEVR